MEIIPCDKSRLQSIDGRLYGSIVTPKEIDEAQYADVTQWLVVGGQYTGEILTPEQAAEKFIEWDTDCTLDEAQVFVPAFVPAFT